MDEEWNRGDPFYIPRGGYENLSSEYLSKLKKEMADMDNADMDIKKRILRYNQMMDEAEMLQNKLGEISVWTARAFGQILLLCSPKEIKTANISRETSNINKRLARNSFDMVESIIKQWDYSLTN